MHQAEVDNVKAEGAGVCPKSKMSSGCHNCSWPKTVRYFRRLESKGLFMEGYKPAAKAASKSKIAAKSKAKAKGKGKGRGIIIL